MDRLKTAVAALLVGLWLPATSFCLLENAGWVGNSDGCPADQCSDSSPCCALASANYKMHEGATMTVSSPVPMVEWLPEWPKLVLPLRQAAIAEFNVSPPELTQSWQFSSRAAPTPRAPSAS
jgi:hypothetical protein